MNGIMMVIDKNNMEKIEATEFNLKTNFKNRNAFCSTSIVLFVSPVVVLFHIINYV